MTPIFHIVDRATWDDAGAEYLPAGFAADGFVHFSFAHQVEQVANARYRDATDLIVVELDPTTLDAPLRVEDSYGAGEEFPHVYGPIPTALERARHELTRDARGDWRFTSAPLIPDAAGDDASPDR